MPFEGVIVEAYKGTRRKHNMKFRQICHTTSQYGQSFFLKTISAWNGLAFAEAPPLTVFRSHQEWRGGLRYICYNKRSQAGVRTGSHAFLYISVSNA